VRQQRALQVSVWTFPGYPPERVLGARFDRDSFAAFIVASVPRAQVQRILRDLQPE
jgi:hypothetical protein